MPGWLRVTIGTNEQNLEFLSLLKEAIKLRDNK